MVGFVLVFRRSEIAKIIHVSEKCLVGVVSVGTEAKES